MRTTSDTNVDPAAQPDESSRLRLLHRALFVILSGGFLYWVTLGQVEARVWISGQLHFLDRRIASMWTYMGQNLPALPAPGIFTFVYWLSIVVTVVGTVAGLWLILGASDAVSHNVESIDTLKTHEPDAV